MENISHRYIYSIEKGNFMIIKKKLYVCFKKTMQENLITIFLPICKAQM